MSWLLVDAAHLLVQFEFVDDFPTLTHPGPDINLVIFVQQCLESFLRLGPQAIVQPKDGVVHIEKDIHRLLTGPLSPLYLSYRLTGQDYSPDYPHIHCSRYTVYVNFFDSMLDYLTSFRNGRFDGGVAATNHKFVPYLEQRPAHQVGFLKHQIDHFVIGKLFVGQAQLLKAGATAGEYVLSTDHGGQLANLSLAECLFEEIPVNDF